RSRHGPSGAPRLAPRAAHATRPLADRPLPPRPRHERAADLQRAPLPLLGRALGSRPGAAQIEGGGDPGGRDAGHHRDPRTRIRYDGTAGRLAPERARPRGARVSVVGDLARRPVAGHGPALAFLLRLDLRPERARLRLLGARARSPGPRSLAREGGAARDRAVARRSPALPPPLGNGGEPLQRAPEALVSGGDLRARAAHRGTGPR